MPANLHEFSRLESRIRDLQLTAAIEAMKAGDIARRDPDIANFSFSHRRFLEYFLASILARPGREVPLLRRGPVPVPVENIDADDRWADVRTLYAEVAPPAERMALRDHAWESARHLGSRSIQTQPRLFFDAHRAMRFLVDAFRRQPDELGDLRPKIAALIAAKLESFSDELEVEAAVEALSLLEPEQGLELVAKAAIRYPGRVSETALAAARFFKEIDLRLGLIVADTVRHAAFSSMSPTNIRKIERRASVLTSNPAFKMVAGWLNAYVLDVYRAIVSASVLFVSSIPLRWLGEYDAPSDASLALLITALTWACLTFGHLMTGYSRTLPKRPKLAPGEVGRAGRIFRAVLFISNEPLSTTLSETVFRSHFGRNLLSMGSTFLCINFLMAGIRSTQDLPQDQHSVAWFVASSLAFGIGAIPSRGSYWRRVLRGFVIVFKEGGIKSAARVAWFFLVFGGALYGTIYGVIHLVPPDVAERNLVAFFGATVVVAALSFALPFLGDSIRLRRFKASFYFSRPSIGEQFSRLVTRRSRSLYVEHVVEMWPRNRRLFLKSGGQWPNGRRPTFADDDASARLADLDREWLREASKAEPPLQKVVNG